MFDVMVGICSFVCGFILMYAIHVVLRDIYLDRHRKYIEKIEKRQNMPVKVEITRKYAVPDDVNDLIFKD